MTRTLPRPRVDADPQAPPTAAAAHRAAVRVRRRRRPAGWLYMMPAFLLVLALALYPLYFAVSYSLTETQMWNRGDFVGLDNYRALFADPRLETNLLASAVYVFVGVAVCTTAGVAIAIRLRRGGRWVTVLRTCVLIPWITSEVVVAITWRWIFNREFGPGAAVFSALGLGDFPNLLGSPTSALVTLTLVNVWRSVAFPMLMGLAALQSVPRELEEAASLDGANKLQTIRHVLLPIMTPVLVVTVIVLTIQYFNMVVLVLDLTGGGPLGATETLGVRLYQEGFSYFNVDTAATLTVVMLAANVVLAVFYFRALRKQSGGDA